MGVAHTTATSHSAAPPRRCRPPGTGAPQPTAGASGSRDHRGRRVRRHSGRAATWTSSGPGSRRRCRSYLNDGRPATDHPVSRVTAKRARNDEFAVYNGCRVLRAKLAAQLVLLDSDTERVYAGPVQGGETPGQRGVRVLAVKGPAKPRRSRGDRAAWHSDCAGPADRRPPRTTGAQDAAQSWRPSERMVRVCSGGRNTGAKSRSRTRTPCVKGYLNASLGIRGVPQARGRSNATCRHVPEPTPGIVTAGTGRDGNFRAIAPCRLRLC